MRLRRVIALVCSLAATVPLGALVAPTAVAGPQGPTALLAASPDRMPGDVPSKRTPWVLDGQVSKIVQVGDVMVAGGMFSQVADPMGGARHDRQNLFAFDAATGQVNDTFAPAVNGRVQQLLPGPTPGTVYVAGEFTKINGRGPNHVQLLDVSTGEAVRSFKAPSTNGAIQTMEMLPNDRLFIGGSFSKVGRVAHGQLATLDATTGAVDPFLDITLAGRHNNTGTGARSPVGARESAITPGGDRLVVVGNFRTAAGLTRNQVVMLELTGATAVVSTTWNTTRYQPLCSTHAFDGYTRDVDMSPDGSYFVIATTGGPFSGTLCDAASRFETYAVGTTLQPTWVANSGGDTLWGVEVTRSAVFVGGHNRWMNNPSGSDRAGQGAVPRPGLSALDPESGVPLRWNPGRNPRGEAAYDIHETDAGVWVVSDTDWIGDRRYRRPRVAFFPYDEGYDVASKNTGSLPGNVYVGGDAGQARVLGFDGSSVTSQTSATTFDWTTVRGAVMIGRTLFHGSTDGYLYRRSFDGVAFGAASRVNPYLDPLWSGVDTGSGETYAGALPSWYGQLSTVTGMFYANGRIYYTRTGQGSLYWRNFSPDSGIVGGTESTAPGGNVSWSNARGMFLEGGNLYVVNGSNGQLLRIAFSNGAPTGTSSVANSSVDWRGRAVFLASVLPNVAPHAAFTSECAGLSCTFNASGSSDSDGTIEAYEWSFSDGDEAGGPDPQKDFPDTGSYDVTLTVTDDAGLSSSTTAQVTVEKPNEPPTAAFTTTCDYLACTFDGSASSDSDGDVEGLAWDFGDGVVGDGAVAEHTYEAPGQYTVTLTATDDDDASDQTTSTQVVVGAPAASTVSYVGGAVSQGNASTPQVTTPPTVSAGDRLLLVLSLNSSTRVASEPTGITGWTVLDTVTSGSMTTRAYTKVATADDADRRVIVPLNGAAKYTMTVAGYSGVRAGDLLHAAFAETTSRAGHPTPVVDTRPGSWVVSYWADKSSATTGFEVPGSVIERQALCASGTGRMCSVLADSAGPVPTGQYGDVVATATTAQATATTWSIVLRTVEPNQAPTASFSHACEGAVCTFDGTESSDPDGSLKSYAWDFGDGSTATGPSVEHDFGTSGSRDVTLTVTDDEATEGSLVVPVSVVRTNARPTASFTVACAFLECGLDAGASADSDGTIASYAWDFGDGHTEVTDGPGVTHRYAGTESYVVTLVVTDNDLGTDTTARGADVIAARPIVFRGSTSNQGNVSTPNTTVPAGVQAGDRLVLVLSLNDDTRVAGSPTSGVTGWTLAGSATSGSMQTLVFTRVAAGSDAGRTVRFSMDAPAKYTLVLAAYGGDSLVPQVAQSAEAVLRPDHATPSLEAADGDWVVSYWADKSSATTGFSLPSGVSPRDAMCAANAGRVCSVLADSAGPVAAGIQGGLVATADSASTNATMWTILLPQAG